MGEVSKIQWTDATWNPWYGCKKVSDGCKYCYMYRDRERYGDDPSIVVRSKTKFNDPLKWKESRLIFTCSWSDFFIEEADEWRAEAWKIIKATPQHTYQILTKRPERITMCLPDDWGDGYDNVWLGVSAESQLTADKRIPQLMEIPACIHFVSFEPLLERIRVRDIKGIEKINWAIIGGESGNRTGRYRYRRCDMEWIRKLISDCHDYGTYVFVKQLGSYIAQQCKGISSGDMDTWPKSLQVQDMPISHDILSGSVNV